MPVSLNQAGAAGHDGRHVGPGLDVVDVGGLAAEAALGREGRTRPGPAALALDGGDERGLLAAHEGAGALDDLDVEVEAAAQDVLAQEAALARLVDGALEALDRQGVLGADVDVAVAGADGVGGDDHALEHARGGRPRARAVHEGAGVALVGVADEVLLPGPAPCARNSHLTPVGKPAPPRPRSLAALI